MSTESAEEGIWRSPGVPGIWRKRAFAAGEFFEVVIMDDPRSRRLIWPLFGYSGFERIDTVKLTNSRIDFAFGLNVRGPPSKTMVSVLF